MSFKGIYAWFEMVGYARAAARMAALGYQEEAKSLMMEYSNRRKD